MRINLRDFFGVIFSLLIISPYLVTLNPIVVIITFLCWIIFAVLSRRNINKWLLSKSNLYFCVYLALIIGAYGIEVASAHDLLLPCIAMFGMYYLSINDIKAKKRIAIPTCCYTILIVVCSIYQFAIKPGLARVLLAADHSVIEANGSWVTADFFFIYALLIFNIVVWLLCFEKKSIFLFTWGILSTIMFVESEYSIATFINFIMMMFGGIFLHSIKNRIFDWYGICRTFLFVILISIAIFFIGDTIIQVLLNVVDNENFGKRILYIYYFLYQSDNLLATSDLGMRLIFYDLSLNTFLNNPLLGIGKESLSSIGRHSSILDYLGKFGLIGNIPFYMGIIYVAKNIFSYLSNNDKWKYLLIIVVFIFVGLINLLYHRLTFASLFVFVPLIMQLEAEKDVDAKGDKYEDC